MRNSTVGILHPGAMGMTVGAAAAGSGRRGLWASNGRSGATEERARQAGLQDVESIDRLAQESDVVISVCPPHAALDVGISVAKCGFDGVYLDANAVSPGTAKEVAGVVIAGGATFVDGGIIGPPAHSPGTTRMYLSGPEAERVAQLFSDGALDARAIGDAPGQASALKMAYAGWTKGTSALILAIRALVAAEGVEDALLEEWDISQSGLAARSEGAARGSAPKAWRFAGEMREIAATFEAVGLPTGFHMAAAEVFERLSPFKDRGGQPPAIGEVVDALNAGRDGTRSDV
jgi:3-hydroxyisobutyrate dehydrogenase-like beta-hydroxyacid dehydrogenase